MTGIIGADVMYEALHGHIERMGTSVDDITELLVSLDVSPDELGGAIRALADARDDGTDPAFNRSVYLAAVLEGVVIGVRAARIADDDERVSDG